MVQTTQHQSPLNRPSSRRPISTQSVRQTFSHPPQFSSFLSILVVVFIAAKERRRDRSHADPKGGGRWVLCQRGEKEAGWNVRDGERRKDSPSSSIVGAALSSSRVDRLSRGCPHLSRLRPRCLRRAAFLAQRSCAALLSFPIPLVISHRGS